MLQFTREFHIPTWDDSTWQAVSSFWTSHGFHFDQMRDDSLQGTRGSLLGNLCSYNMSKLLAKIEVSRSSADRCCCVVTVNTILQQITACNKAYWTLEMDTFESHILRGDDREAEWAELKRVTWISSLLWTFSFTILGRSMLPKDWDRKVRG